jgi:hypothetical protein
MLLSWLSVKVVQTSNVPEKINLSLCCFLNNGQYIDSYGCRPSYIYDVGAFVFNVRA